MATKRFRKRWALIVLASFLALFELAYVVAANRILRSGKIQEWVNTRPEKLKLDFDSAWTLIPGWVHVKGFRIEGIDGKLRWRAELESVQTLINLVALPSRSFQTLILRGQGGLFRLTPADPVPDEASRSANPRGPFWIRLGGMSLEHFNEITIVDYSYRGEGFVGGSFDLWPGRSLEVESGDIEFFGGRVFLGERELSSRFEGRIDAEIERWLPKDDGLKNLIEKVSAHIKLSGDLEEADFLNHYVESIPWLKLLDVSGKFDVDARIENGAFVDPSKASLIASKLGAGMSHYQASGRGSIAWHLDTLEEKPLLKMNLALDRYAGLDTKTKEKFAEGKNLKLTANSYDLSLKKVFSDLSDLNAHIELGEMKIPDLRFANSFVPIAEHFKIVEGSAELSGRLSVSTRRAMEVGIVKFSARDVRARFRETEISGDFGFTARLQDSAEGTNIFDVSGSRLAFTGVKVIEDTKNVEKGKKPRPPWAGEVSLQKGQLDFTKDAAFSGTAELDFDDARPVLAVLANTSRVARLVARFADIKKLRGTSDFLLAPDLVEFDQLNMKSSDVDLRAKIRLKNTQTEALAFIKFGILELGLSVQNENTESKIVKSEKWYEKKLKTFNEKREVR